MRFRMFLVASCLVSTALYLGLAFTRVRALTFPLDDAWIHLTFARNLALRHEFAYSPGQLSAGSTSPLWTLALVPGFWLPGLPEWWDYLLGAALLLSCALLSYRLSLRLFHSEWVASLSALTVALEWHLNWAAFSGMETLLFIALLLLALDVYAAGKPLWLSGLIAGLATVTRPEGAAFFALLMAYAFMSSIGDLRSTTLRASGEVSNPDRLRVLRLALAKWVLPTLVFFAPLIPYVWFNWTVSGLVFPNTFYAKQVEYAELFAQQSALAHYLHLATVTFVGAQLLLAPGFAYAAWLSVTQRRWFALILLAWCLLLPLAYALRLPVDYQHARYEMPVIPGVIILGAWGTYQIYCRLSANVLTRVITRAWLLTFGILLASYWLIGAAARANDVVAMDCLEVQTVEWLTSNAQRSDVIAAHDIGAIGYYLNGQPLLDLAGLITPDVIYFLRDEQKLLQFILQQQARYVVTSAAWHANLIRDPRLQLVFQNACSREMGGYQIGVFLVKQP